MSPKQIKKLTEKKYRTETGLFLVEGEKNIAELLNSDLKIEAILGTKPFLQLYDQQIKAYTQRTTYSFDVNETKESELVQNGSLISNNAGIAVVVQKKEANADVIIAQAQKNIVLILDDIRDPGNMGTIIRTADWYGVTHIVASPTTVDLYNPKVISATMGSFARISVSYIELDDLLFKAQELLIPVIIGDLAGKSTHEGGLPKTGLLLMGSESHGVNPNSLQFATHQVMIPRFGNAESLNVSVATGILLDTLRRGF